MFIFGFVINEHTVAGREREGNRESERERGPKEAREIETG